jgi:RNA polymerase sigma factor (TIGR02999 family)
MTTVTQILRAIDQGQPLASEHLLPLVYDQLRELAARKLARERPGQTLNPTALVHEAYLRLVDADQQPRWENRRHFFAAAAEAMRRILIDNARRKRSVKHGGGLTRQDLDEASAAVEGPDDDVLALDEALTKLAEKEPVKAELVKLRYFGGLTADESARTLDISSTTAERYWNYARAWLHQQIQADRAASDTPPPA